MPSSTTAALRAKCRAKWGADWHRCHPIIRRARLTWANGYKELEVGTNGGSCGVYDDDAAAA